MKSDHTFSKKAKGGYVRARHQIGFNDETRKAITTLAKLNNQSFAAQVRALVQVGLSQNKRKISFA